MLKEKSFTKMETSGKIFKELFEHISSGVAVYDVRGDGDDFIFKDINKAGERIDKIKKKDVIGKSVLKMFPEIKNFGIFDVFKRVYKTGKPEEHPISFYRDNRISGWRRNYVYKLPSDEIVSVFDDKTRQKQAEESLKLSEEFSSSLMKSSPTSVLVLNADYSMRYMNPAFEKLLGFKLSELMGKKPPFPWATEEISKKRNEILKEISKKRLRFYSLPALTKDGKTRYVNILASPVKDKGKLKYILISFIDVTEQKIAENIIESERNKLKSLIEGLANTEIGIDIVGLDYKIYYQNKVLKDRFGKMSGKLCYEKYMNRDKPCDICNIENAVREKRVFETELLARDKRYYKLISAPLPNPDGTIDKVIEVVIDITGRKEAEEELVNSRERLKRTLNGTINTLAAIVETKDPYTYNHQQRVCKVAMTIAKEMNLEDNRIEAIRIAALIHDIGKVNIPASILSKPGKLTDIEFEMIKTHPQLSYDMLKNIEFPLPIIDIIIQHHEKLDGSGYPKGLKDKDIMIEAKILTVSDVVEAMSSHRPYRPALGMDAAMEEIKKNKGILYDPAVVDNCVKIVTKKGFKFD